jgi:ketosteroid isomerase-like protein
MNIARKHLPRRTFLKGVGAAVALPAPDLRTSQRFLNNVGGHMENIKVINKIYEAFGRRDYAAVLDLFSPKIEWIAAANSPLADRSPYRGLDEVREGVFMRIAAGFERLTVRVDEIFGAGDKVVALGFYDGVYKRNGKRFQAQVAHIWTLADGKAVKFQQYVDTYQLAESFK